MTTHFLVPLDILMRITTVDNYNLIEKCPKICLEENHIKEVAHKAAISQYALSDRNTESLEWAYESGYKKAIKDLLLKN